MSEQADIDLILSPRTIRQRADLMLEKALQGGTRFDVDVDKLDIAAELVEKVTLKNYPTLEIPFHSRWRHFHREGVEHLEKKLGALKQRGQLCARLDLIVVSVLLDAGAGEQWAYREGNQVIARSEGLAVASLYMFLHGDFSSNSDNPLQVDALGLEQLGYERFLEGFQVSESNPLLAPEGRFQLLKSLAGALKSKTDYFSQEQRPGALCDYFLQENGEKAITAGQVLQAVQKGLGIIWPGREEIGGFNLGDVWRYADFGNGVEGLVPFHKLSQWLSYSLLEPLIEDGWSVEGLDELTGLAEYRNGGLFVDSGVLIPKSNVDLTRSYEPGSELIVEWRALTLALLDRVAEKVRSRLGRSASELPLVKILEGGSWAAGRVLARERRGGAPPIKFKSDGTVF
jgi:hypothetical protein